MLHKYTTYSIDNGVRIRRRQNLADEGKCLATETRIVKLVFAKLFKQVKDVTSDDGVIGILLPDLQDGRCQDLLVFGGHLLVDLDGRSQRVQQQHQGLFGSRGQELASAFHDVDLIRSDKFRGQVFAVVVQGPQGRDLDRNATGRCLQCLDSDSNVLTGHIARQDLGKLGCEYKSTALQEGQISSLHVFQDDVIKQALEIKLDALGFVVEGIHQFLRETAYRQQTGFLDLPPIRVTGLTCFVRFSDMALNSSRQGVEEGSRESILQVHEDIDGSHTGIEGKGAVFFVGHKLIGIAGPGFNLLVCDLHVDDVDIQQLLKETSSSKVLVDKQVLDGLLGTSSAYKVKQDIQQVLEANLVALGILICLSNIAIFTDKFLDVAFTQVVQIHPNRLENLRQVGGNVFGKLDADGADTLDYLHLETVFFCGLFSVALHMVVEDDNESFHPLRDDGCNELICQTRVLFTQGGYHLNAAGQNVDRSATGTEGINIV